MDSGDVGLALAEMFEVLTPRLDDRDWSEPAGVLEWTCLATAGHVAHDLLAYAGQLAARPQDAYLPFDLVVKPGTAPRDVLRVVQAAGAILGCQLDVVTPRDRAWHWGPTDAGGFAAMGVDEILVHTWDIAQGLGIAWMPPDDLAAKVLERLFATLAEPVDLTGGPSGAVLLWATGRIPLADRPRRTTWVVKAAVGETLR